MFLLLAVSLGGAAAFAQADFRPGYVVTNAGDTLRGEIDYRGNILMGRQCTFRAGRGTDEVRYSPAELVAYHFDEGRYFQSRRVDGEGLVFLEVLVQGELDVYYYKGKSGEHYYVEKVGMPFTEVPAVSGMVEVDGKQYARDKLHAGTLNYFTQDAPALQQDINKMTKLTPKGMIRLAEQYHGMVCTDGSPCVVYQSVQPVARVALEVSGGGFVTFRNRKAGLEGGLWAGVPAAYVHVSFPRVSERFFLRTGFAAQLHGQEVWFADTSEQLFASQGYGDYASRHRNFFKIPLQVEYQSIRGTVRPKLAYGITYYLPSSFLTSAMAGVNIFLTEHVALSVAYEAEFFSWQMPLIPASPWGQSVQAGVYVAF